MNNKRQIGKVQEELAKTYLEKEGYQILTSNYYSRVGEIDLIAMDGKYLVFVEVKYRSNNHYGYPEEALTYYKMKSIIKTAKWYLVRHGISEDAPCRFDVVTILGENVKIYKNAFTINDCY